MIKFFRHIRQQVIKENRVSRYVLYAIGEIVLVVIGILFALQINNWNSERLARQTIHNYYERMYVEIESEIEVVESFIKEEELIISMNRRTLNILASKDTDSIPALKESLGALGTAWTLKVNLPVTQEFINQGYLSKVENDSLKSAFKDYSYALQRVDEMNDYTTAQYNDRIEPFINRRLNYSEIALPGYKKGLVQGGPQTDFESLFTDLELWNTVTFKLESLNSNRPDCEYVIARMKNLSSQVRNELEQSNSED
jgi:hypothetical protein